MSNLCLTKVIDNKYMAYAPLFVWCARQAYKTYDIVLFTMDECPYSMPGATVIPLFENFPRYPYNPIALRFLVSPKYYAGYDYVYITDIDMMIMPERITIEDFHKNEMTMTGLCYSNSLRNINHYAGFQSLTGLHFATKEWFIRTEAERLKYYALHEAGLLGLYREWDGVMLYRMARNSGLRIPGKYKLKKRHHGIHLGNFRLFEDRQKWADRIPKEFRVYWKEYESNPEFKEILAECRAHNAMLDEQITMLDDFIANPTEGSGI